jgi:hypothetical protein
MFAATNCLTCVQRVSNTASDVLVSFDAELGIHSRKVQNNWTEETLFISVYFNSSSNLQIS